MTFQELFQQVKTRFLGADVSQVSDPTRIQINLTGQAAGTFYVEMKGGHLAIEPYEYHDRDALIDLDGAVPENDISEKPRREHRDRDRRPRREHRE